MAILDESVLTDNGYYSQNVLMQSRCVSMSKNGTKDAGYFSDIGDRLAFEVQAQECDPAIGDVPGVCADRAPYEVVIAADLTIDPESIIAREFFLVRKGAAPLSNPYWAPPNTAKLIVAGVWGCNPHRKPTRRFRFMKARCRRPLALRTPTSSLPKRSVFASCIPSTANAQRSLPSPKKA